MNLRNQYSDTFANKVFAENIVYQGKKMKLTDEKTYEMVHSNLNALELSDETGTSMIGRSAVISQSQVKQGSPTQRHKSMKRTLG